MKHISKILLLISIAFASCHQKADKTVPINESETNFGNELQETPTLSQRTLSSWCVEGNTLANRIDFTTVKHVKLRNAKGPHHLTTAQWNTLKPEIEKAKCIQGLMCKPKSLSFWFEFENGEVIDGYFCGKYLNFDRPDITGSFELSSEINLENY